MLRNWNGSVDADSAAAAIVNAARAGVLADAADPQAGAAVRTADWPQGADLSKIKNLPPDRRALAICGRPTTGASAAASRRAAHAHAARWLPTGYATWDDFLAAVVQRGLRDAHAPHDLSTWQQGKAYPVDIEHPIFSQSHSWSSMLIAVPTGTGPQPQSGDGPRSSR